MNTELLVLVPEKDLYQAVKKVSDRLNANTGEVHYMSLLEDLNTLKQPIDDFFDDVMVMDENPELQTNRLVLLKEIRLLFLRIADISLTHS